MSQVDLLTPEKRRHLSRLVEIMGVLERRKARRLYQHLFPDEDMPRPGCFAHLLGHDTIFARSKYPKHLEFFAAGARYRQRCFMAANRIGKTVVGSYEVAAHLTGRYPDWWRGKRFTRPIKAWAAGKTNETTRDIVQATLLGAPMGHGADKRMDGCGVIPGDSLGKMTWKQGVTDLADTVKVRHASGGWSTLGLKSYQQGRGSFEGTAQSVIWFDEEPPMDVYGEALIRTATTHGVILLTFTPLEGLSEVVQQFLPTEMRPDAA